MKCMQIEGGKRVKEEKAKSISATIQSRDLLNTCITIYARLYI